MKNEDFSRFADKFIEDAHNLLNELEGKLLELEGDTSNHELIESVFRSMHTLKGIGSMFGFTIISEYTHHLETIYDKIREGLVSLSLPIFEVTFASVDHIRNLLADQNLTDVQLAHRHTQLSAQIESLVISEAIHPAEDLNSSFVTRVEKSENKSGTWYILFFCSEDLVKRAVNILYIFQDLAKIGTYNVFKHSPEIHSLVNEGDEVWGIVLTTTAPLSEIEEVFMFVSDSVRIVRSPDVSEFTSGNEAYKTSSIIEMAHIMGSEIEKGDEAASADNQDNSERGLLRPSLRIPRISVGTDKLDKLMYLVSELFTARSELVTASRTSDMTRIKIAVEKIDKLSAQFRNNALSIRLVPLRELTLKFKRLIRDLSNQLGKNIEFEVQGDDTELDKNLVDSLADPFLHVIRNCIDHGIESPDVRKANQKPVNGLIRFTANQAGNYIYIQISDDGKGIDTDYIRQKAIAKGFIQPNAQLSERELLELIFLPGFTTAENLTQVSGRGVGMDVVKRAINNLRGIVEIDTEIGKGTTFTFKLQQTIVIMDTLLIKVGNSFFTIILEEIEVCELESHQALYERQNNHLQIGDDLIPFISLRQAFSIAGEAPQNERIIVVKQQSRRFAVVADTIIGQFQAVIKPLGEVLGHKEYLSGASIMGDGNIAFMLDTQKLCSVASHSNK